MFWLASLSLSSVLCKLNVLFVDLALFPLLFTLCERCRVPFCLALPSSLLFIFLSLPLLLLMLLMIVGDFKLLTRCWLLFHSFLFAAPSLIAPFAWFVQLEFKVAHFDLTFLWSRLLEMSTFSICPTIYTICVIYSSFCLLPLVIILPATVRLCALLSFAFLQILLLLL